MSREMYVRLALVVGSVTAFLAAAEIGARLCERVRPPAQVIRQYDRGHFPLHRILPGDPLGWDLAPGPPAHNALGMKDWEYPAAKPSGTYRILILGDSVAFGYGLDTAETFENQLEMLLARRFRDRRIEVLNMSVPGYNTAQELLKLRRDGLGLKPDLVVVAYTMNDDAASPMVFVDGDRVRFEYVAPDLPDAAPAAKPSREDAAWSALYPHSALARYLYYAVLRIRLSGKGQDETQTPPGSATASMRALAAIRDEAAAIGARTAVVIFPLLDWTQAGYPHETRHARIRAFLEGEKIPYVDLIRSYMIFQNDDLRITKDDNLHPNRRGHTIASVALEHLLEKEGLIPGPLHSRTSKGGLYDSTQEIFAGMRPQLVVAGEPRRTRFMALTTGRDRDNLYILLEFHGLIDHALDYTFWLDDHADPLVQIHVEHGHDRTTYQVHQNGVMLARQDGLITYEPDAPGYPPSQEWDTMLVTIPREILPGGFKDAPRVWVTGFEAIALSPDGRGGGDITVTDRITEAVEIVPVPGSR